MKSLLWVASLVGCGGLIVVVMPRVDPTAEQSVIVKRIEASGAGSHHGWSAAGLSQWFGQHQDLAVKISLECRPMAEKATAQWIETAEGTACTQAGLIAAMVPPSMRADTRAW